MKKNLYQKVFEKHIVEQVSEEQYQLFIGLHMIHEVTSPQAFAMLEERSIGVLYPRRNFATIDHIIPTENGTNRPFADSLAEEMTTTLEKNVKKHDIEYFSPKTGKQGIVHVVAHEQGLTQPGMTICCGDSHTSTNGAFGSISFGIGTSQVKDILATQTLITKKLKVRKIEVNGTLGAGVYAKDLILYIIHKLGASAGAGYAYEYCGTTFKDMSIEERMTVCNMSIEGGARVGYVNPDKITYDYIEGRNYAPKGKDWEKAVQYWEGICSDEGCEFDDIVVIDATEVEPFITWGINPAQAIAINDVIPDKQSQQNPEVFQEALDYMGFEEGEKLVGKKIDVAFIGSCTNGRFSDFEEVVQKLEFADKKVSEGVRALIVPGSQIVHQQLVEKGYDKVFKKYGFEFRSPGCSMCLAMNSDKLIGDEVCASSSNRNYKGRQGSATGKTLLMSPVMVAATAISGEVVDPRKVFNILK